MENVEVITKLVNFCVGTARLRTITVEREVGLRTLNRAQAHLYLRAPMDSLKTALLHQVAAMWNKPLPVYHHITSAGLIGSIEKSNTPSVPGAWAIRNKMLILDEFNVDGDGSCTNVLLDLLEGRAHTKKVGRECKHIDEVDGDLFWKIDDVGIHLKSRFACVIASMHNTNKNKSDDIAALISRCIYYEYKLTEAQKERISEGHDVFGLEGMKLRPPPKTGKNSPVDCLVKNVDFKHIKAVIKTSSGFDEVPNWLRLVDNCVRYYCYNGMRHDDEFYGFLTRLALENESMKFAWGIKEVR